MADHDPQIWVEARHRLPLPRLMEQMGDGIYLGKKAECPFCAAKGGKWAVFHKAGRDYFKCHKPECAANDPDGNSSEIGYLALRKGMSMKEAATEYLRLAFHDQPERVPHLFAKDKPKTLHVEPEPAKVVAPRNPWEDLQRRLPLIADDESALQKKRGFSPETIRLHGLRSNKPLLRPMVEALTEVWTVSHLVAEGIYKEEGRSRPGPAGQFCGYGITGEKDEDGKAIWALTEPIIIPYFNEEGEIFYLRPHKGGVKRPKDELEEIEICEDEEDERHCASHVFVPRGTRDLVRQHDGLCIFTEGEFKAIAATQCGMPAIACPGISFIRNPEFRRKLLRVIEDLEITDLVIIFDNEVKDDPAFPKRYKPDPKKQWDTQKYAQYTMRELRGHFSQFGGSVKVGQLPDELRIDGKTDFDGILATCVLAGGYEKGSKDARRIFKKAVAEASGMPTRDLFPSRAERIITAGVEAFFYQPEIASGGKKELELAKRFRMFDPAPMRLVNEDEKEEEDEEETKAPLPGVVDKKLAEAFSKVIGCYYLRKPPEKEMQTVLSRDITNLERVIKGLTKQLKDKLDEKTSAELRAKLTILYSRLSAAWERKKGLPIPISTFTLKCEYLMHGSNGLVDFMVRVQRYRGGRFIKEKALRLITRDDAARLADFRKWALGIGDAVFGGDGGGDKDLQMLTKDLNQQGYLSDIYEITTYGWDRETGIWFFGDCAFPPKSSFILPDDSGIFWHEGIGYKLPESRDANIEAFSQGAPLLFRSHDRQARAENGDWLNAVRDALIEARAKHPVHAGAFLEMITRMFNDTEPRDVLKIIDQAPTELAPLLRTALTRAMLKSLMEDMFHTIGDYDGWVAVALQIAYAVGPELRRMDGHPGNWLTGRMSSGKTTIGRWLMRPWGFKELGGIKLGEKSSTAVGINRGLTQYSSLPFLFDEYRRHSIDAEKEEVLRGAFDSSGGLKGVADGTNRTRNPIARTTPMVMGESSSGDSATRSRYAQIHVTSQKRIGDGRARYMRVQKDCKFYFLLGRWLMENRPAFAEAAMDELGHWMQSDTVRGQIQNDRVRHVYGTAYAVLVTMSDLLGGVMTHEQKVAYHSFLIKHGEQGLQDVIEETFLAKFWQEIITMRSRGKVSSDFFQLRYVRRQENNALSIVTPGSPNSIYVCYIAFNEVFSAYQQDAKTRGEEPKLGVGDLQRELEREQYFLSKPEGKNGKHQIKMTANQKILRCWAISLEREANDPAAPFICPFAEDLLNTLSDSDPEA